MDVLALTDKLKVHRLAHRQVTDRQVLHDLLDAGLVAHVGVVRDGEPVVLPVAYARDGDDLLLHGSTGAGLLRAAAAGEPIAVTVTVLDGLVVARSAFDNSMNYRSMMAVGRATALDGEQKLHALRCVTEHVLPGRWDEVRPASAKELAATLVLRLPLDQVSVKMRSGGPSDGTDDGEDKQVWAGVLPLRTAAAEPVPGDDVAADVPVPPSVLRSAARWE